MRALISFRSEIADIVRRVLDAINSRSASARSCRLCGDSIFFLRLERRFLGFLSIAFADKNATANQSSVCEATSATPETILLLVLQSGSVPVPKAQSEPSAKRTAVLKQFFRLSVRLDAYATVETIGVPKCSATSMLRVCYEYATSML